MKETKKLRLVGVGVRRKGERGFKIREISANQPLRQIKQYANTKTA